MSQPNEQSRSTSTVEPSKPCAVIVGAGTPQGIGGAACTRFAAAGMHVYATGRSLDKVQETASSIIDNGGKASAVAVDATQPTSVFELFEKVAENGHVPEVVVFNASERNLPKGMMSMTPEYVENMWRVCCFGGFLTGQEAIRRMLPQGRGTLIFTGASASLRGRAKFGGFAAAKAGLRTHAQAMAREFQPKGIHVAHVVIDGLVAGDRASQFGYGLGKAYLLSRGEEGSLDPAAIAETYWQLHIQPRTAWTHELELRPFKEKF